MQSVGSFFVCATSGVAFSCSEGACWRYGSEERVQQQVKSANERVDKRKNGSKFPRDFFDD
jgi:hypothetical protein